MVEDVDRTTTTGIALPGGRQLVIRDVRPDDAAGLTALYDGLDAEDRQRRFFCPYRPSSTWFDELADVARHGGARVVAELVSTTSTARLVAEAGYAELPNGNGDLDIVVDRPWRGWLGPYLLGRVVEAAAARGVPNLEADVLTTNGPMLALLQRRGAVVVEHDGWSTVRLRIGTTDDVASWEGSGRHPWVLVETPGGRWGAEDDARRAGLTVLTCPGPGAPGQVRCPVLDGRRCPLVAGADAVVVRHPRDDERWAALVEAHRRRRPDLLVVPTEIGSRTDAGHEVVRQLTRALVDGTPLATSAITRDVEPAT